MIMLQAPYGTPEFSIELPNPELGDNLVLAVQVNFYKAMDGSRYGYKKSPHYKKHRLSFADLTRRRALLLLEFCRNAAGKTIKYIDKDNQIWSGILLTGTVENTTTGPGTGQSATERKEANGIVLEFEGVLIG